ncbi:MAG: protein translocase subunit SecD [Clostridia bacterium]|nr:protein translocase subunit SecD [Clostridia bacterium]MDR3645502.1 protein translocase subunit SecD [Clostridia bacterium]
MKYVYKHAGKPAFFIVLILIAVLSYVTVVGIRLPNQGDTEKWLLKGAMNDGLSLGIDIQGGVDVTFAPKLAAGQAVTSTDVQKAYDILNSRLDDLKITDRTVVPNSSKGTIIVRFPWPKGTTDYSAEDAISKLGTMATLTFKDPNGNVILTGADVKSAAAKPVESGSTLKGSYYVELTLSSAGTAKFSSATKEFTGKTISIYMDSKLLSAPTVDSQITSSTCVIEGTDFTSKSANDLAKMINAGALPFALVSSNYSSISPQLGLNALNVMLLAGLIAFILVCLFMIFYYRLPGLIACLCLCGHMAGMILSLLVFGYTLTLPGIAGLILSVGMGVDCNIITAERIKEELREGRTLDGAIDLGFERSFTAIFDGNVTVLIAGIILLCYGSASVKSFGFTLVAGVVFNFVMGIIASRYMLKSISKYDSMRNNFLYGEAVAK